MSYCESMGHFEISGYETFGEFPVVNHDSSADRR